MTIPKNTTTYRKATAKDIGWGKTIYLTCNETARSITLEPMIIDKLTLKQCPPIVGMNAFQHDDYRDKVNAERLAQMKVIANSGGYWVEK